MKASFMVWELSVECIVRPAPAEKPIMPILSVSTPHSSARFRSWRKRPRHPRAGQTGPAAVDSAVFALCAVSAEAAAAGRGRFIHAVKSSSDSGVGWSRYLSTKAAIPCFVSASATSQPSLPIESHLKPPPGATITAAPFALPGSGRKGVRVAVEMFRAIGSPHWRNQVSGAGWSSTPPVPSGMAFGSAGASRGKWYHPAPLHRSQKIIGKQEQPFLSIL